MGICDSRLWMTDLEETIRGLPEISDLAGKTVMVTGCTGLIGSAVADILICWNLTHEEKIRILAAGRNEDKIRARFALCNRENWFSFVRYDAATGANDLRLPCDYIIHGASNASPNKIVREPVETMLSNFTGLKELLDYSREVQTARLLYISSSEVYGRKSTAAGPSKEDEYGWIDLLNPRSSYSVGKCAAETLCACYADEYRTDSVIVRPGHIYGPTALKDDNRVSTAWAYAAAAGEDIVMKSAGTQIRSYCYCLDCASAILTVLLKGKTGSAYNISNPDSVISIRDMAELLADYAGITLRMDAPSEADIKGFNPMQNSSLDSTALLSLGWKGRFDAKRGFQHTVEILREMNAKKREQYGKS